MALDVFTTVDLTRSDAGFGSNANVKDGTIEIYVKAANGEVGTAIAANYAVPLSDNSNYEGSLTQDFLVHLATNLAAGLLLLKQYEGQSGDMEDLALAKIESSRSQLKEIQKGTRALVGYDGAVLTQSKKNTSANTGPISGFPDNTDECRPVFGMDDVF